jgi:hypothetical protein
MPRDGAIIFSDLIGKLDMLRVECAKCGRSGRYRLADLITRYGRDEKLFAFTAEVIANCAESRRAAITIRAARFVRTCRASGEQNL